MYEFRVKDLFVRYPEIAGMWFETVTIQLTMADIIKNSIRVPLSISTRRMCLLTLSNPE